VATAQDKDYASVTKAIHDAVKTMLDAAVTNGLDQARADEILSKLDAALASGDFPQLGHGHGGFPGSGDNEPEDSADESSAS
jgi:hypothetical protein